MFKRIITCLTLGFCSSYIMGQSLPLSLGEVNFIRNGDTLKLNNIGGLNAPVYSNIDFNNDGIEDLLIFDKISRDIIPLVHLGGTNTINYRFAPEYIAAFPLEAENFLLAYDYNCDGIKDLIYQKYSNGNIVMQVAKGYYVNNKIQFLLVSEQLSYLYDNRINHIPLVNGDLPALADIDNDGDMDIVAFNASFFEFLFHAIYYKNYSIERGYGCDSLIFEAENTCFGQFQELGSDFNTIEMSYSPDSCANNEYWRNNVQARHTGSSLTAIDYDRNGVMDLVMGDAGTNTLNLITMRNMNGTLVAYEQDSLYPSLDTSVNIYSFPAAYYVDVNNDGITDLIAASAHTSIYGSSKDSTSWLYINKASSNASPLNMQLENKAFLYDQMIDLGAFAYPTFVDLNNDGLMDLVVGNGFNESANGDIVSFLQAFLNVGTAETPIYELIDADFANQSAIGFGHIATSFADLNGDGALDMVVGNENIYASIYINRAPLGSIPVYDMPEADYLQLPDIINKPSFFDFDNDGDMDLVFGDASGRLVYFENTGTASNYAFSSLPTNDRFGLFDLNTIYSNYAAPRAFKNNNATNILLGHSNGQILVLSNIDNNLNGSFTVDNFDYAHYALGSEARLSPDLADINGDGKLDMVVGNSRGGLNFFLSSTTPPVEDTVSIGKVNVFEKVNLYPNPAKDKIQLDFPSDLEGNAMIYIYNVHGQLLLQREKGVQEQQISINTSDLSAGIYFISLQNQYNISSKVLILNK